MILRQELIFLFSFYACSLLGQTELNYPEVIYGPEYISASWVSHPDLRGPSDQIVLFRNTFDIDDISEDFIINISGDNHYFLYVNEMFVTHGPQLSDIKHWKYETLNLKKYLKKGKNVLAVKVVDFGKRRFLGMQSLFTSLMVNGITANSKVLTTTGHSDGWKCSLDQSYRAIEVNWRGGGEMSIVGGFYANNPTDFVDMNSFQSSWRTLDFDDSKWQESAFFESGSSMGGSIGYLLEPRNLPLLTWEKESIGGVVRSSLNNESNFPNERLEIKANTRVSILIDQEVITNGFPELRFSNGKNAHIKIRYAENLFGSNNEKGDRDQIAGKSLKGYYDHIISNGDSNQIFSPNWMRTFRYIEFEIETKEQPLILNGFVNYRSRTEVPSIARFTSDNDMYNRIFEICKRTVDICTQDYFLSDAYYETMQYVGDTKVQALLWNSMSGNLDHTKNAIRQFHHSRDADGNILGAFPLRSTFIYPTYSLIWVDMIADYYELTGDKAFIEKYKNGIVHTIGGFEENMNELNLVNETPYRYFVDWYTGPNNGGGTATNNDGKNSAVVSLHYAHTLMNAAKLFAEMDDVERQIEYAQRAEEITISVYERCYNVSKGLFAERPDQSIYDQHTNIMAILTDAIEPDEQERLLNKILMEEDLLQATYYYRFYLFEAIKKVNAPKLFDVAQKPWEEMIKNHMSTTLERFESAEKPTRSEVHPWSASPAYFYFNYLAGIQSIKNNFEEVRIAPVFGVLQSMEGVLPTPRGEILFRLKKTGNQLLAEITIPSDMKGHITWGGQEKKLKIGRRTYIIE